MRSRTRRRILDSIVWIGFAMVAYDKMGWWYLLMIPFGLWNFYDGQTREDLV